MQTQDLIALCGAESEILKIAPSGVHPYQSNFVTFITAAPFCLHRKASYTRAHQMVCKPLANGSQTKCLYVWDRTVNLCYAIRKRFAYHSSRTEIYRFFARTRRELDALGVLCLPQVRRKLINHTPLMRCMRTAQRVRGALVYTKLNGAPRCI